MNRTRGLILLCIGFVPAPLTAQARDSAGIRIVESARPSWSESTRPTLGEQPRLVIGNQQGEAYLFSRIAGAVRLANGMIVVADGGSAQLRFFDSAGAVVRRAGRRGSGPGEFDELGVLYRTRGDTLLAGALVGRQSYFSPSGAFLRAGPSVFGFTDAPPGPKPIAGVLDDQSIVAFVANIRPDPRGRTRWVESGPLVTVDRAATRMKTLGTFPVMTLDASRGEPQPVLFSPHAVVAVRGAHIYTGFGDSYSIAVRDRDGRVVRIIRRAWTPRAVSAADFDAYVEAWIRTWTNPSSPNAERERRELRGTLRAERLPAFSELLVDAADRVWVREPNVADAPACGCLNGPTLAPSRWSVFAPDGAWLGDLVLPARFNPTDIGRDYVLGIQRDADGVATVVLYGLG